MIKIKKYAIQVVPHYDENGILLGLLNEYESLDLRCQIAEQKAIGYYLMFENVKIPIHSDGSIKDWKPGLYDVNEKLLSRLFSFQKKLNDTTSN